MKKPMRNPGNIVARCPGLDGLRAIACLIVLINHAAGSALGPIEFGDTTLQLGVGKIGVWLFFVLSAFLLSLQFISATYAPKFLPDYILGRILRILPAFMMAVVLYRFLGGAGIDNWEMVWFTITMQSAPAHLWTIPAEFAFYFVLPLIILPAIWLTRVFSFWAAAAFGVLTLIASIVAWPPLTAPPNSSWFGYYMPVFLSGLAAAVWARKVPVHKSSAKTITIFATVAVAVIIVVAKIAEALSGNELLPRSHFLLGPMFGLVVYGVYVGAPRWLENQWLCKVGEWSFSIYLLHWGVLFWVARLGSGVPAFIIDIAFSIAIGCIGYYLVERPAYSLRRALFRNKSEPTHVTGMMQANRK